jgi:hypothetical protein
VQTLTVQVCIRAPGAACTAFTPGAEAVEGTGDLVVCVRLPLDMERRTGDTGPSQQETQRDFDKAATPLVKRLRQ